MGVFTTQNVKFSLPFEDKQVLFLLNIASAPQISQRPVQLEREVSEYATRYWIVKSYRPRIHERTGVLLAFKMNCLRHTLRR